MSNETATTEHAEETMKPLGMITYQDAMKNAQVIKTVTDSHSEYLRDAPQMVSEVVEKLSLSSDAKETLSDPNKAREISNFIVEKNKKAFDIIVGKTLSQQQKDSLYVSMDKPLKSVILKHLKNLYPSVHGTDVGNAVLIVGSENTRKEEEYGDSEAQVRFLWDCGEALKNDDQKRDMLKAALEAGFSASAVFSVESKWKLAKKIEKRAPGMLTATSAVLNMLTIATELTIERVRKLREAMEKKNKKKADEEEKRLANLVGTRRAKEARDMLEKQGEESEEMVAEALQEQLKMSKKLHSGRLGEILPRTEGPVKAA